MLFLGQYAYGGGVAYGWQYIRPPPANALWQFTPSAQLGEWSYVASSPASNFSTLTRTFGAISAYGNGLGFSLGGEETSLTTPNIVDEGHNSVSGMGAYYPRNRT